MSEQVAKDSIAKLSDLVEQARQAFNRKDAKAFDKTLVEIENEARALRGDRIKVGSLKLP